ncbi:MAG: hypothetical protein NZ480_07720, partial [Bdellovibrionaceae bacterium]|nr:hypothetical protein [Pseudobdellovibrionaceae bacterium]
ILCSEMVARGWSEFTGFKDETADGGGYLRLCQNSTCTGSLSISTGYHLALCYHYQGIPIHKPTIIRQEQIRDIP